jgi:hypothetical protein
MTTRKCIKCGKEKPVGQFDDNWRHKVNICKQCRREYQREYQRKQRRRSLQNKMYASEKRAKELKEILYGEKKSGDQT